MDLIKSLAGKRVAGGLPKPKGLAHPGEVTEPKARFRYEPARYGLVYGGFGLIRTPPRCPVKLEGEPKAGACFKAKERHGEHWLTKAAGKLKREWQH